MRAKLLSASENRYKGKWIEADDLSQDSEQFGRDLAYSLASWSGDGTKVVWLTLPEAYHQLIGVALAQGFNFHHVSPRGPSALILTKRLIEGAMIPDFAHHTIGVGGIVLNAHREVLSIVEWFDLDEHPERFKFPGGSVDKGEHLTEAVVREVKEETGVEAKFNGIVGFRHYHRGQFSTSNIYILCVLEALTTEITPCPEEIGKAKWIACEDFLASENIMPFNKKMLQAALSGQHFQLTEIASMLNLSADEYEIFSN